MMKSNRNYTVRNATKENITSPKNKWKH